MSLVTLPALAPTTAPRGAVWAAEIFAALLQALSLAWRTATPQANEHLRRGREAAALRRYAAEVGRTDPRLANEFYAAADRHIERD